MDKNDVKRSGHSLIVRRSFLQKEDRRSRARLNCPLFSASSKRRSEGSERAATSPTGRRATVAAPSDTPRLSKHIGPAAHSSLAEDRTRARAVLDCRPRGATPPRPVEVAPRYTYHANVLIQTSRLLVSFTDCYTIVLPLLSVMHKSRYACNAPIS